MIKIRRSSQYANTFSDYLIVVDDEVIGAISDGQTKKFALAPGKHEISLKIDWCRSNTLQFDNQEDEEINFYCGCQVEGIKQFFVFFYVIFSPNDYLWIERII